MKTNITFVQDDNTVKVCAAWLSTMDETEIAVVTELAPSYVKKEVARLKMLKILQKDNKLDDDVKKYLETRLIAETARMAEKIRKEMPRE